MTKKNIAIGLAVMSALVLVFVIRPISQEVYVYISAFLFWVVVLYYLYNFVYFLTLKLEKKIKDYKQK